MTISGEATSVQHSTRVSGARNGSTSTSYITLFRVDGLPCEMTTSQPVPLANGDRVIASGSGSTSGYTVYAIRNLTAGVSSHSGFASKLLLGLLLPIFGVFFCGGAANLLGSYSTLLYAGFIAYSLYHLYQAYMVIRAKQRVAAYVP